MTTSNLKRYEKHCDIFLVDETTKEKYPMISTLLKCKSSYFDALLDDKWNPLKKSEFLINTNQVWTNINNWIFTGKLTLKSSEFCLALEFADMYGFEELIDEILLRLPKLDFKFIEKHLDFLMQERFFEILIHFRKDIVRNYFQPTPLFSLLATVVAREQFKKTNNTLKDANWITKSATLSEYPSNEETKEYQYLMTLIKGVYLELKKADIQVNGKPIQCSIKGLNDNDDNNSTLVFSQNKFLILKKTKLFSRFIISSKVDINDCNLTNFQFDGNYKINLQSK